MRLASQGFHLMTGPTMGAGSEARLFVLCLVQLRGSTPTNVRIHVILGPVFGEQVTAAASWRPLLVDHDLDAVLDHSTKRRRK